MLIKKTDPIMMKAAIKIRELIISSASKFPRIIAIKGFTYA